MTSRTARCSSQAARMAASLRSAMPGTWVSWSMSSSNTRRVRSPKWRTMRWAIFGPTPEIRPEPRYFSSAPALAGFSSLAYFALNWRPNFGWCTQAPTNSMVAPAKTRV